MTILCSPKVTQHHIGAVASKVWSFLAKSDPTPHRRGGGFAAGQEDAPWSLGPPAKTNWLGKNEWVTSNREARRRGLPFLARGQTWANPVLRVGRFK